MYEDEENSEVGKNDFDLDLKNHSSFNKNDRSDGNGKNGRNGDDQIVKMSTHESQKEDSIKFKPNFDSSPKSNSKSIFNNNNSSLLRSQTRKTKNNLKLAQILSDIEDKETNEMASEVKKP